MRVCHVSAVSATDGVTAQKQNEMRGWREVPQRRDAQTAKKKSVTGRQIWVSFTLVAVNVPFRLTVCHNNASCAKTAQNLGIKLDCVKITKKEK